MRLETIDDLKRTLGIHAGSRVAIIGNAASQFGRGLGAEIDGHDLVVRLNYGAIRDRRDQGSRTDLLGCSDPKITLSFIRETFQPRAVAWLTSKAPSAEFFDDDGLPVYVNTEQNWAGAARFVEPARPSSGALAAHLFRVTLGCEQVTLYGFDFFTSPTFYHRRSWRFWRRKKPLPHAGDAEQRMMQSLGILTRP